MMLSYSRNLQGGVKVPTGGKAREPFWHDPVKLRSRQLQSGWKKMDSDRGAPLLLVYLGKAKDLKVFSSNEKECFSYV